MMWTAKEVLALLSRRASPNGIHFWANVSKCLRYALLSEAAIKVAGTEATYAFDVGTMFHELAERYHMGQDCAEVPRFIEEEPGLTLVLAEAWRLFDFYKTVYAPDAFGTPVGSEFQCCDAMHDFGGRLDLVTSMTEGQAEVAARRDGQNWTAGTWIVDFKTHAQADSQQIVKDYWSLQALGYPHLLDSKPDWVGMPPRPCAGFAHVHVIRHAKMSMEVGPKRANRSMSVSVTPRLPVEQENALLTWVDRMHKKVQDGSDLHNLCHCTADFKLCPFLLTGECTRGA